jgi:hypothetical protein
MIINHNISSINAGRALSNKTEEVDSTMTHRVSLFPKK